MASRRPTHVPRTSWSAPQQSSEPHGPAGSGGVRQGPAYASGTAPTWQQPPRYRSFERPRSGGRDEVFRVSHPAGAGRRADELRIVMVGRTGAGKSAAGNTILGRDCFESVMSPTSKTEECSKSRATVFGQRVAVVDTPGLFDTRCDPDKTCRDIGECVLQSAPGPHAFLIVIRLDRFTSEERQTVEKIQEIFGEAADAYSMVLFTRGDELQGPIEDFVNQSPDLLELVHRCDLRYHVFNNKQRGGRQVEELLQKIGWMVKDNGGGHYTNEMFREAERAIRAKQESILKERAEEIRLEKERVAAEVAAEFQHKFRALEDQVKADRKRDQEAMRQERREMAATVNDLQRQGQQFIEEKIQMAMERQNMQLVRAQESAAVQNQVAAYNQQVAQMSSALTQQLQLSEQRQQVALQTQRVEMERQWNQREEARVQAERAQWERDRRALQEQLDQERRRREQEVDDRRREEARRDAEEDSSVLSWAWNKAKSFCKGVGSFFGKFF